MANGWAAVLGAQVGSPYASAARVGGSVGAGSCALYRSLKAALGRARRANSALWQRRACWCGPPQRLFSYFSVDGGLVGGADPVPRGVAEKPGPVACIAFAAVQGHPLQLRKASPREHTKRRKQYRAVTSQRAPRLHCSKRLASRDSQRSHQQQCCSTRRRPY